MCIRDRIHIWTKGFPPFRFNSVSYRRTLHRVNPPNSRKVGQKIISCAAGECKGDGEVQPRTEGPGRGEEGSKLKLTQHFLTQNDCYQAGRTIVPLSLIHISLYVGKVGAAPGLRRRLPGPGRGEGLLPPQMADQLGDVLHRVDGQPSGQGGLGGGVRRDVQRPDARDVYKRQSVVWPAPRAFWWTRCTPCLLYTSRCV